jgi:formylglycine-generating enzyme required for sulfatase activity
MNCLTWYEAMAFCAWDGGYLPTEAEWNYAAAGGDLQRAYPWSSRAAPLAIDSSRASYGPDCDLSGTPGCTVADLSEVGIKPAGDGRWGQSDLAGNISEWTLDSDEPTYINPCTDCAELTAAMHRMVRGGSFAGDATLVRTGYRLHNDLSEQPTIPSLFVGVRCARNL